MTNHLERAREVFASACEDEDPVGRADATALALSILRALADPGTVRVIMKAMAAWSVRHCDDGVFVYEGEERSHGPYSEDEASQAHASCLEYQALAALNHILEIAGREGT